VHSQAGASTATRVLKQEFLSLFASSGKIVSLAAEADAILSRDQGTRKDRTWITDGLAYTRWIGRSVTTWVGGDDPSPEDDAICSEIFARALRLGYGGKLTSSSSHSHV
jgi:telomere length regulation protein